MGQLVLHTKKGRKVIHVVEIVGETKEKIGEEFGEKSDRGEKKNT